MRTKDKKNNIKKVNLLIEMRSQLINENPPYHMDMGDPVTAGKAQYGYLEGDSPELIGKEVWFHTNRHNIMHNKNGAFGVYGRSKRGRKDTCPFCILYLPSFGGRILSKKVKWSSELRRLGRI